VSVNQSVGQLVPLWRHALTLDCSLLTYLLTYWTARWPFSWRFPFSS